MRKILSASMIAGAALLVSACGGEKATTNTANTTMGTDTYNSMDTMGGNAMGGDMMGGNMSGGNMSGGDMMGGNMSGGNMSGGNMSGGNTMNNM
jgi:uncharacterized protein YjbI with pentapeptide repeats